jgi:AbrB family looped-hinge helix DNA binding protein
MLVTSKGQVTIPLHIRNRYGLKPGTAVEFVAERGAVRIQPRKPAKSPVDDWLRQATGAVRDRTTAQLAKLTRGDDR